MQVIRKFFSGTGTQCPLVEKKNPEGSKRALWITAIAVAAAALGGIWYLERQRREEDYMNGLKMTWNFRTCRPDEQGRVPLQMDDYPFFPCPPSEVATHMHFPDSHLEKFDYFAEANRVCEEGFPLVSNATTIKKIQQFCEETKEIVNAIEEEKGYYRRFLEDLRPIDRS